MQQLWGIILPTNRAMTNGYPIQADSDRVCCCKKIVVDQGLYPRVKTTAGTAREG